MEFRPGAVRGWNPARFEVFSLFSEQFERYCQDFIQAVTPGRGSCMATRKDHRLVVLVDGELKSFLQERAIKAGESVGVIVRRYLELGRYAEVDGARRYRNEQHDIKMLQRAGYQV